MTDIKEEKTQNKVVLVQDKLSKIIHREGDGDYPKKGQEVHALYRGTLQNGSQFDSNQNRDNPFKFTLGQGQVIKGWDEGFASMRRGEKATLICAPQYAYGARGSPPRIPANSTLHFEVELLDFCDKKKEKWDLSIEQKIQQALKCKNQGNDFLKKNQLVKATQKYNQGIQYIDSEQDQKAKALLKVLRMNSSQAYLKEKQYTKAIELCTKVLKEDPNNVKTLYRRGVSYLNNQDYQNAKNDIDHLLRLQPENDDAKLQLIKINQAKKAAAQKEKKIFGGMFSKSGLYDDKKPSEKKETQKQSKEQNDSDQMPELQKDEENDTKEKQDHHHHDHEHGHNCSGHDHSHHSHDHEHGQSKSHDHEKKD